MSSTIRENVIGSQCVNLWNILSEWSQEVFGPDDVRGPIGAIRHLMLEAKECEHALIHRRDFMAVEMELADCLILVLDASRRYGMTLDELLVDANAKMCVNMSRKWPTPTDSTLPIEHIREHGQQ